MLEIYRGTDGTLIRSIALAEGMVFDDENDAMETGFTPGILSNVTSAANLTGAGHSSFLVGSSDGYLYSVSAEDGSLDWSLNLRASVGEPIAADVDGDGLSEVLVPSGDGYLHMIDQEELSPPAYVYDTDGSFIAMSADEDLDEIGSTSRVGANWADVTGATSYEYQVVRTDDVVVVPWIETSDETRSSRSDLSLEFGKSYKIAVRARSSGASGLLVSSETMSDGFTIVDPDPPDILVEADPTTIYPVSPGLENKTRIHVTIVDDVGLRRYELHISDLEGSRLLDLDQAEIGGTTFETNLEWGGLDTSGQAVATGQYVVVAAAEDGAGNTSQSSAEIIVCMPDDIDEELCPALANEDLPDEPDAGFSKIYAFGSGCTCSFQDNRTEEHWLIILFLILNMIAFVYTIFGKDKRK